MMRASVVLLLALAAACGGGAKGVPLWERPGLYGAARPEMGPPQVGDAAPDFDLPTGEGGTFHSASLRGAWVVLHFTASWCPYCDAEIEHLGQLAEIYRSDGVKVVLVDIEEDEARWATYSKAHVPPTVVALRDATGDVAKRFAPPRAQPSFVDRAQVLLDATIVVDPEGQIRLFLFPDSKHFDPTFAAVRGELDRMVEPRALRPENVVVVDALSAAIAAAAKRGEVTVRLRIAPGYHVMSDRPSAPQYVATRVTLDGVDGLTWGEPRYPPPVPFELADETIDTFQGSAEVRVPYEVAARPASSSRTVTGTLRYQACTKARCLFPVTRTFEVEVR